MAEEIKKQIDVGHDRQPPQQGGGAIQPKPVESKEKPKRKEKKDEHEFVSDVRWVTETANVIEVDEDNYREFFKDIVRQIRRKVRVVKRQIPNIEPRKHGYIAYPKKLYDQWFDKKGNIKKGLKLWELDMATRPWDDLRQNNDGSRAIFEVWWYQKDIDEFMADTKGKQGVSSSFEYATDESDGIEEWKKTELSKPEWQGNETV